MITLRMLLSFCLIFFQFQSGVSYKSVAHKNSVYLKNRASANKSKYKKRNNYWKKLDEKERRDFYCNLELNHITDNKLVWKTIKAFLIDKIIQSAAVTLVNKENNQIMPDNLELAEAFDNYSAIAVANLGIKTFESSATDNKYSVSKDDADLAIEKCKDHPCLKMINETKKM